MLPHVTATRYAVPLREGGSMPGLVEADDLGMYVVKMRGAGQGLKVLVAEVIVGEIGRALGIAVPDLVTVGLSREIARFEADEEVQDLLTASVGLNLGMDYLPGAFGYDGSRPAPADVADAIVWLDAFTANVDRTWSNPNLLLWHDRVWAIDHGAALWFHHGWVRKAPSAERFAAQPFDASTHVLRDLTSDVGAFHGRAVDVLDEGVVRGVVDIVPDEWLESDEDGVHLPSPDAVREAYVEHLLARLASPAAWLPGGRR
ncbi:aminotransferase class I and II [Janibacter sp. YIM B02568]|uniref:HipA family kinase n=1 Tax=Janibacter endophyticus TaxID=2806261 RepID=UPI00194DB64C|nr:HipA family kinase [Janibacter endophyticus]MBM6546416.1 aminotransferase class I and II [Janibacter endophyticus]